MEESKFLEAQNLKNQISYLEKWLKDTKREDAKIGVCWAKCTQELRSVTGYSWEPSIITKPIVNQLPTELESKVIKLVNNELELLNRAFNEL